MASVDRKRRSCSAALRPLVPKQLVSFSINGLSGCRAPGRNVTKAPVALILCALMVCVAEAQPRRVMESLKADRDLSLDLDPSVALWRDARPVYIEVDPNG